MIYFDKVENEIKKYSDEKTLTPLSECRETIEIYNNEKTSSNPYRKLAKKFEEYKANSNYIEDDNDWYFYKYLKSLNNHDQYNFPLENGTFITVNIDLLEPYVSVDGENIIHPRWHLLVSWFAYIDAANNHPDNEYASKINNIKGKPWTAVKCESLKKWKEESII